MALPASAAAMLHPTVGQVVTLPDTITTTQVSPGLLKRPRYVPAEEVAQIAEGELRLALSKDEFDRLGEHEEPPASAEILPP